MAIQIVDTARFFKKGTKPVALENLFTYRRPQEVKELLAAHPYLASLLMEAYGKINECFGSQTEIVLELVSDPEADDDRELFAFIQTNLSPEAALERLDRLDQEWWLDASAAAQCQLCIDDRRQADYDDVVRNSFALTRKALTRATQVIAALSKL